MNSFPCLLHFIAFFEVVRGCPRVKAKCSILLRILVNYPSVFVYIWKTAGKIIHIILNAWQELCWPINTFYKV